MFHYAIRRVAWVVPIFLTVSVITFLLMHAVPGGPFDGTNQQGAPLTPELRAVLMKKYHLDRPIWEQYLTYMGNVLLRFDFGWSFQDQNSTCIELIKRAWPVSLHLGLMTFGVALIVGLTLGIFSAKYQNSWVDYLTSLIAIGGIVTPSFVVAVGLMFLFTTILHWLPTGGWEEPKDWIMPVMAYSLGPMAVIARYTRSSLLEVIRSDYIRTARAKGLGEFRVMSLHVLRNGLIPLITIAGPIMADLITGSIFIESIFRIPGVGRYFTTSIFARDYPMIMTTSLFWSTLIVVTYFITDMLYAAVDPRIRYEQKK
jgi:ABC-type dipeptide/oligopeptide/nickel transport system permease component